MSAPLLQLVGHDYAVRKVLFSPHVPSDLLSCSYDLSVKLWDIQTGRIARDFRHHTEFVVGIDWCLFVPGRVVGAGGRGARK